MIKFGAVTITFSPFNVTTRAVVIATTFREHVFGPFRFAFKTRARGKCERAEDQTQGSSSRKREKHARRLSSLKSWWKRGREQHHTSLFLHPSHRQSEISKLADQLPLIIKKTRNHPRRLRWFSLTPKKRRSLKNHKRSRLIS